jgi:hypothetical protein
MDAQFAPILAIQIESELTVPYDSESSMPVEHPECIGHVYPQNRTRHHPLLIQVNPTMNGCCCLSTVEVFVGVPCFFTTCPCVQGVQVSLHNFLIFYLELQHSI